MKGILLFLLIALPSLVQAQFGIIQGRIVDDRNLPLPFATVYINQTTIGTVADGEGKFVLGGIPVGQHDIVASFIGYEALQTPIVVKDGKITQIRFVLTLSTTKLESVEVRAKKDSKWDSQLEKFKKLFFGTTVNASLCKISNPWVLEFSEDEAGRLVAQASAPLDIENLSLGYQLSYTLQKFAVRDEDVTIHGLVQFSEMESTDKELSETWTSRRKQAYYGSPRHLLKAIVDGRVEEEGFLLYKDITNNTEIARNGSFMLNMNAAIVTYNTMGNVLPMMKENYSIVNFPSRIEAHYKRRVAKSKVYFDVSRPVSWLEVEGGSLNITKQGVPMNGSQLRVLGAMNTLRVADILPFDYVPIEDKEMTMAELKKADNKNVFASLIEKPYLQLDKPYYYRYDAVHFKGYMSYAEPQLRDSLSHVLYVDLLDMDGKLLQSKAFPIADGVSSGDLLLGDEAPEGDYILRASTRWMLNYGPELVFQRPLKVIAYNKSVRATQRTIPAPQGVRIITEKEEFRPRENITITIDAVDVLGIPRPANLSISVTDMEQSFPPNNEQDILTAFPLNESDLASAAGVQRTHPVENGFKISGTFVSNSKKDKTGVVRFFHNSTDPPLVLTTDNQGRFSRELQLMDSMDLYVEAFTPSRKRGEVVLDSVREVRPAFQPIAPIEMEFYVPDEQSRIRRGNPTEKVRILDEVTVKATKITPKPTVKKDVMGSSKIDYEYMMYIGATDVLSALQRRVAGVRVRYQTGGSGFPTKTISIMSTGGEPMLVIDGVALVPDEYESVAMKLSRMHVQEVETVEVLKYGGAALYGTRAMSGVIVVKTQTGAHPDKPKEHNLAAMQVLKLPGYAAATEFTSPDYSKTAPADLDVRSTIYWNPSVVTIDKDPAVVSFYAADITGTYRIVVEGVTEDGKAVRAEKLIRISE